MTRALIKEVVLPSEEEKKYQTPNAFYFYLKENYGIKGTEVVEPHQTTLRISFAEIMPSNPNKCIWSVKLAATNPYEWVADTITLEFGQTIKDDKYGFNTIVTVTGKVITPDEPEEDTYEKFYGYASYDTHFGHLLDPDPVPRLTATIGFLKILDEFLKQY